MASTSARRTSGASRSCCRSRSRTPQERVGQFAGHTPLIRADRLGAELGLQQPLPEGRLDQPPVALLQGPRRRHGDRPPAGAGQGRGRLRLDRQRRHRGRGARPPRPAPPPTSSTPATWRRARRRPAARSAPRSVSSTATTTRPTAPAASSRWRAGSSSPTSPCGRSTPRGRRRWPSRSSRSSAGSSPDHFVIPAAGGTLSSRVHKGLNELEMVGLARDRGDQDQHRPGRRLLADRDRDPRGRRDRAADPGDRRPLAGDRRPRRRHARASTPSAAAAARRRRRPTRRSSRRSTCSARPRASSPSRPAAPRSPRRPSSPQQGKIGPDDDGRRDDQRQRPEDALSEHPDKPWPEMVACNVDDDGRDAQRLPPRRGDAA